MSFCRWSSDDFQCDVYVYEDLGGRFTTHVAFRRVVFDTPLPPPVPCDREHLKAFLQRNVDVEKRVDAAARVQIGLPHDGRTFIDATAAECADRLESLRTLGYRVPQYAIDALREPV